MSDLVTRWAQRNSIREAALATSAARDLVSRYVAGRDLDDLVPVLRSLIDKGLMVSVGYLGDHVDTLDQAAANQDVYLDIVQRLSDEGISASTELSLRLSRLGQRLGPPGSAFALQGARKVCRAASNAGVLVTVDMANHELVGPTLHAWEQLQQDIPSVGITVQAALYRSQRDLAELAMPSRRIRLCKGVFREPKQVAFRARHEIDLAFVRNLRVLMNSQAVVLVATHDPRMISIAEELIRRTGRPPESYEFQMMYGIRPMEQRRLADIGHRSRVLVPFGPGWYDYYTQRLAERPANAGLLARSLLGKR